MKWSGASLAAPYPGVPPFGGPIVEKVVVRDSGGGPAGSYGPASARPAAAGTGSLYFCTDIGIVYLDDVATMTWKAFHTMGYGGDGPGDASGWTVVGTMGVQQKADALLLQAQVANRVHHILRPIPLGVAPTGPWQITLVGVPSFQGNFNYPVFGINVANGITPTTSIAYFSGMYNYNGNVFSKGAWTTNLNTQTRPGIYLGENIYNYDGGLWYFRLVNDGANYVHTWSTSKGAVWRPFFNHANTTPGITNTHWGCEIGCPNGTGLATATVQSLNMSTIPQVNITNVVHNLGVLTVTTATPHDLVTGDSITITQVVSTGTTPNAVYTQAVIVLSPTTFTVPGAALTYTSGGKVTLLSR